MTTSPPSLLFFVISVWQAEALLYIWASGGEGGGGLIILFCDAFSSGLFIIDYWMATHEYCTITCV